VILSSVESERSTLPPKETEKLRPARIKRVSTTPTGVNAWSESERKSSDAKRTSPPLLAINLSYYDDNRDMSSPYYLSNENSKVTSNNLVVSVLADTEDYVLIQLFRARLFNRGWGSPISSRFAFLAKEHSQRILPCVDLELETLSAVVNNKMVQRLCRRWQRQDLVRQSPSIRWTAVDSASLECPICLESPMGVVDPCWHLNTCQQCARKWHKCLVCQRQFQEWYSVCSSLVASQPPT